MPLHRQKRCWPIGSQRDQNLRRILDKSSPDPHLAEITQGRVDSTQSIRQRVGGHVDPVLTSYDGSRLALLPHNHWISVLITHNAHQSGHPGIAATTAKARRKFWIIKGHDITKVVKREEIEAKAETQFMATLPSC